MHDIGDQSSVPRRCPLTTTREDIVRDLLRNEPTGDYSPEELFSLNLHSRYDCEALIFEMYCAEEFQYSFQVKGTARGVLTRRCNRLWNRLSKTVDAVRTIGGPGIYRVWIGIDTVGYTWAPDLGMAQKVANTMYGYLSDATGNRGVKVTYMRCCTEEAAEGLQMRLNDELRSRAKRELSEAKRSMAMAENKLAQALAVLKLLGEDACKTGDSMV